MRRERRQESMATCARGAGVWLVPKRHTLLRSRTKLGSSAAVSFLQLPVALFADHPSITAIPVSLLFASPRVTPFGTGQVQHPRFSPILSEAVLLLQQRLQATPQLELDFLSVLLCVPNSGIYYFCMDMPARFSTITPEDAKGKTRSFLPSLELPIVKSRFYKPLQGSILRQADEAVGKTTSKELTSEGRICLG